MLFVAPTAHYNRSRLDQWHVLDTVTPAL